MDGRYEEVFSNLEERTEMTGASRSWLFIESCWKLEMQQVGTAFIQWRLPNMYLSSPHKKKSMLFLLTADLQTSMHYRYTGSHLTASSCAKLIFKN